MNKLTQHLKTVLAAFFLLLACMASAQEFPEPMQPRRLVNDFTGMFSSQETARLEQKLRRFNDTTSTQIAIAVVPSLHGYAPNDYAQRLAEQWGIGQQGKDNGILILLKPKNRDASGQVAIAVGYGLEGVVPDAIASRIIRNEVIPAFQQGAYYAGIDRATTILMQLTGGEFTAEQYARGGSSGIGWFLLPFFLIVFLAPLFRRRRGNYTADNRGSHGDFFPPFFFGGFGGGNSGGFGSFTSGSGTFGGFGGGSFGGGGASGEW